MNPDAALTISHPHTHREVGIAVFLNLARFIFLKAFFRFLLKSDGENVHGTMRFGGKFLPVETKLSVNAEANIIGQVSKTEATNSVDEIFDLDQLKSKADLDKVEQAIKESLA